MNSKTVVRLIVVNLFCVCMALTPFSAFSADRGYVSNMLILTVRTGPGPEFGLVRTLRSNMPVDILETRDGYTRILTEQGEEGWVESQYITLETPPNLIIEKLEATIADLVKTNAVLQKKGVPPDDAMAALKSDYEARLAAQASDMKTVQTDRENLRISLEKAEQKYQDLLKLSEAAVETASENTSLKEMNAALEHALGVAKAARFSMFKTAMIQWFLAGGGLLLIGWLLGRILAGRR